MKLVFYNHYGIGDLFESREFVRDWMQVVGVGQADYAHRGFPGLFEDLPMLRSVDIRAEMDMRVALTWLSNGTVVQRNGAKPMGADELWVNTWIGARNAATVPPGDYVIWPGVGCTVEHLHRMHNDYLSEAGYRKLPRAVANYLPVIYYGTLAGIDQTAERFNALRRDRLESQWALICNGPTGSGHAENFDFAAALARMPESAQFTYLLTHRTELQRGDVVYTDDLTGRANRPGWCDVNHISFLSQFCRVIAGRCSGAQMPCQTYGNWMDATKRLVCFTHHRNGACFVLEPEKLGLAMRVIWSPAKDAAWVAEVLREAWRE